jgi:hypothetical protein
MKRVSEPFGKKNVADANSCAAPLPGIASAGMGMTDRHQAVHTAPHRVAPGSRPIARDVHDA